MINIQRFKSFLAKIDCALINIREVLLFPHQNVFADVSQDRVYAMSCSHNVHRSIVAVCAIVYGNSGLSESLRIYRRSATNGYHSKYERRKKEFPRGKPGCPKARVVTKLPLRGNVGLRIFLTANGSAAQYHVQILYFCNFFIVVKKRRNKKQTCVYEIVEKKLSQGKKTM